MIDRYLTEHIFSENILVHPSMLDHRIVEHLTKILVSQYPTTYKNMGYVSSLDDVTILDNSITLAGQIIYVVEFKVTMYVPKVGHVFTVKQIQKNSKHFWVNIGPLNVFLPSFRPAPSAQALVPPLLIDYDQKHTIKITDVKSDNSICMGELICV